MNNYRYNLGLTFHEIVSSSPDALAIIDTTSGQIDFRGLFRSALVIQEGLQRAGIEPGDVVGICDSKSADAIAGALACLLQGSPYCFLDPATPKERMVKMATSVKMSLIVCSPSIQDHLLRNNDLANEVKVVTYRELSSKHSPGRSLTLPEQTKFVDGATIAYIMFTSGSTGTPQAVPITHQSVINFCDWVRDRFEISMADRFASVSPLFFDNSVFDLFGGLFNGAALDLYSSEDLQDVVVMADRLLESRPTIWFSVPSAIIYMRICKVFTPEILGNLRIISFGGEGFPKRTLQEIFNVFTSRTGVRLINVYGPTEATCICSSWDISPEDFESDSRYVPLGHINPNFSYLIQNEQGEASSIGELVLLGPQVASGYYNNPSQSNQSFFIATNPPIVGKRAYRTGDIVREENGILFFEGRIDNQIKHMGYRIELEEIESVISKLGGVLEVGCVYAPKPSGQGRIVAAVAAKPRPNMEKIMNHLRKTLPNYMIPDSILFYESLPKSANGKVSRALILQKVLESDGARV